MRHDGAPVTDALVASMAAALARRGPHGSGQVTSGPAGLAHRLLRATPESAHESQPLALGGHLIVADIRLDYRAELMETLGLKSDSERAPGDAELVIRAYQRWGDECVLHLLGDFAFALWDGARRRLFCARDHFGARPFVYHAAPALFAFGSEAKALLELPDVPRRLNEERVADFLVDGYQEGFDSTITFLRDVFRLPPAHTLTVEGGRVHIIRYWSVLAAKRTGALSPGDAVDGFREHLTSAVRERLRGHPAVGSMLSGGLDSSTIVAFAAALGRSRGATPLQTFSCVEDDAVPSRESDYIRLAAGTPGVAPTLVRPGDVDELSGAFDDLCDTIDDPFDMMTVHLLLYRAAHRAGLTAMLDGCDGDLVCSRNGAMRFALQKGRWRTAWQDAKDQSRWEHRSPVRTFLGQGVRPALRGIIAGIPGLERRRHALWHRVRRYAATAENGYIRRSFAERVDLESRSRRARDHFFPAGWSRRTPDEEYAHWLESGLIQAALERYDRLAASQSIEPRHPLLDVKLVGFYLGVPWDSPANAGLPKAILRRAAAPSLPAELCDRLWEPGVHQTMNDALANLKMRATSAMMLSGIVDQFVNIDALRASSADGGGARPEHRLAVVRIALLAAWLRRVQPQR